MSLDCIRVRVRVQLRVVGPRAEPRPALEARLLWQYGAAPGRIPHPRTASCSRAIQPYLLPRYGSPVPRLISVHGVDRPGRFRSRSSSDFLLENVFQLPRGKYASSPSSGTKRSLHTNDTAEIAGLRKGMPPIRNKRTAPESICTRPRPHLRDDVFSGRPLSHDVAATLLRRCVPREAPSRPLRRGRPPCGRALPATHPAVVAGAGSKQRRKQATRR